MVTPLYCRSEYSLLNSMCRIHDTVLKCKENGMNALAIVDKNVLLAAKDLKKECEINGIKPIFGMEVDLNYKDSLYPVVIYAKNDNGYKEMMKLSSLINTNTDYKVSIDDLNKCSRDSFIVFLSDDLPISKYINSDELDSKIDEFKNDIPFEFLIGIADNNVEYNAVNNANLKKHLVNFDIKTLALSRTYYINKEDAYEFELLRCIDEKRVYDGSPYDENRYFLSQKEYESLYDEKDLLNNEILVKNCNVKLDFKTSLPVFKTPNDVSSKDYLVSLARKSLEFRLNGKLNDTYIKRLNYELKVIIDMGFTDYFLIVYDYIKYAKKNGILVGPGRGSGAGALVSYALGITDIDPIKYDLLFERFLNPERISMPDIDCDFPDDKRDDVINYVKEKYGEGHVAHIITYGTLKAKQSLRDLGRALGFPLSSVDSICKTLPQDPKLTLRYAYDNIPSFRQRIEISEENRNLYKSALKIENLPRHYTTHPAGIVFSKDELSDVCPLIKVENDIYSVQYPMEYLEDMGLIKMDFLAIKNLTIISDICREVKNNVDPSFDIHKIPLDDPKTFELIDDVNILGIFQLDKGMKSLIQKMKPKTFDEIGMMIALYRPGPMDNIPLFLKNRENPSSIKYLLPSLEPILKSTYGIIVYQEQIMTIARVCAGFSFGKADILRRAMSKKKLEILTSLENEFISGCIKNGYSQNDARSLYDLILKFANYGFNKSHSVVYAMVSYQMSYLKANYPLYFYKALLNENIGDSDKTSAYLKEFKKQGGEILDIDINESLDIYKIVDGKILLPISIVKDLGGATCFKVLEERNKGVFKSFLDATIRLTLNGVNKAAMENLISAGALDKFEYNRYTMLSSLDAVLSYTSVHKNYSGLDSIGDDAPLIEKKNDNKIVCAEKEKKVLGFYLRYNPFDDFKEKNNINAPTIKEILEINGRVKGFGHVTRVFATKTKKGEPMEFIDVEDSDSKCGLVLMPRTFTLYKDKIKVGDYVFFEGKHDRADSVVIDSLKVINND